MYTRVRACANKMCVRDAAPECVCTGVFVYEYIGAVWTRRAFAELD